MHIQKGIKFLLHKRKPGDTQNLSIRMRVTMRGKSPIDFPTGHNIDLVDWDSDNQCALRSAPDANEINRTIDEWKAIMNEIFARYELLEKRVPTPQELKDLFNDMSGRESKSATMAKNKLPAIEVDLFAVFNEFIETVSKQNQWAHTTVVKFRSLERHLKEYDEHITFKTLDEAKLSGFTDFLQKKNLVNTTVAKYIAFFRWFLRWASQKGLYKGNLHQTFKPKMKGTSVESKEIIFCTQEEIKKLQDCQFSKMQRTLEYVRDMFLFCCFTGLRYSDAAKLKKDDIKNGVIHIVTRKTNEALQIELNKHAQAILDKYKDFPTKDNTALPVLSNVKANLYLKTIGQMCGLDEPTKIVYYKGNVRHDEVYPKWALLTTHCARRTFVITALQLGIPAEIIMKWTGHSDYDSMKPYIKIVDKLKEDAMTKFDNI